MILPDDSPGPLPPGHAYGVGPGVGTPVCRVTGLPEGDTECHSSSLLDACRFEVPEVGLGTSRLKSVRNPTPSRPETNKRRIPARLRVFSHFLHVGMPTSQGAYWRRFRRRPLAPTAGLASARLAPPPSTPGGLLSGYPGTRVPGHHDHVRTPVDIATNDVQRRPTYILR
eukprot:2982360-Rhodomonas_salina.2